MTEVPVTGTLVGKPTDNGDYNTTVDSYNKRMDEFNKKFRIGKYADNPMGTAGKKAQYDVLPPIGIRSPKQQQPQQLPNPNQAYGAPLQGTGLNELSSGNFDFDVSSFPKRETLFERMGGWFD